MVSVTGWRATVADRGSTPRRFRRPGGVRFRAAIAATGVVAMVLALAGIAFVLLQRQQLERTLTDVAGQQAADVAVQAEQEGNGITLSLGGGDQALIQVVDAQGEVIASSPSVDGEPPVISVAAVSGPVAVEKTAKLPIGEGERFVVVARGVATADGAVTVLAAQSLESVEQATEVVSRLLLVGYPLVLLTVALTSYWLTGRALAPVEAIRQRVDSIDGARELSARVPVPAGDDEIARLATTMNSMLTRLQANAEAQRQFVGDASHELRSPLSTIRVAHEIAQLHPDVMDWPTTSREVLAELDRLDLLVSDLLLLARADEHGLRLRRAPVDVADLVRLEAERVSRADDIDVRATTVPVEAVLDRHALERAVRNLTENAVRHAESQVELRVSIDAGHVVIDVVDDGPGVPASQRDRIFERFVRLDESRARDSGGTGLGLPIARQIATAHHGDLVLCESPAGTHFRLSLPIQSSAQENQWP